MISTNEIKSLVYMKSHSHPQTGLKQLRPYITCLPLGSLPKSCFLLNSFNKTPPNSHQMPGCVSSAGDKDELTDRSERQTHVVHASCTVINDFLICLLLACMRFEGSACQNGLFETSFLPVYPLIPSI